MLLTAPLGPLEEKGGKSHKTNKNKNKTKVTTLHVCDLLFPGFDKEEGHRVVEEIQRRGE